MLGENENSNGESREDERGINEVNMRREDKKGKEKIIREVIKINRGEDMIYEEGIKKKDKVGESNWIEMIVGKIDNSWFKIKMKFGNLKKGMKKKRGIKVRKRLVEKEKLRVEKKWEKNGEEMEMEEWKLRREKRKVRIKRKNGGRIGKKELNIIFRRKGMFEKKKNIGIKGKMRIKRIRMEKNGNEKYGRRSEGKVIKIDEKMKGGKVLEKRDGEKKGWFKEKGRKEEDDEIKVIKLKIDVIEKLMWKVEIM